MLPPIPPGFMPPFAAGCGFSGIWHAADAPGVLATDDLCAAPRARP